MLLVCPSDVGLRSWHRMIRDGSLAAVTSEWALAPGVASTAEVRERALAPFVAHRGALTGLAALWMWGCADGSCPMPIDVAVTRGSHPDPPPRTTFRDWTWHTDSVATARATRVGDIWVCTPADAVVAALRTADLGLAISYTATALRRGLCEPADVDDALARTHRNAQGRSRAAAAWPHVRALNLEATALPP